MPEPAINLKPVWIRMLKMGAIASFLVWAIVCVYSIRQIGKPYPGFLADIGPHVEVAIETKPDSAGIKQGLAPFDSLLSANGRAIHSPRDINHLVQSLPLGTPITYVYERNDRIGHVTVRTEPFRLADFASSTLPELLIGFLYLLIGTLSYWFRPRNLAAQGLLLVTLAVGLDVTLSIDFSGLFQPLNDFTDFAMGSAAIYFTQVFPEPQPLFRKRPGWLLLLLIPPALVALRWVPYSYTWFSAWNAIGLVWFLGSIGVATLRAHRMVLRTQGAIVMLGATIAFIPFLAVFLIPVLLGQSAHLSMPLYFASILWTTIFPLSIAYAIVRHQMFDIQLVIKRTVVYASVVAALTAVHVLILSIFRASIEEVFGASGSLVGNVLATALVAVMFAPLRDRMKLVVDRLFFRAEYQFDAVISEFGETAREILDSRQLLYAYLQQVERALHPTYLAVLSRPDGAEELVLSDSLGLGSDRMIILPVGHAALDAVYKARKPISDASMAIQDLVEALCLPLSIKGELTGCVLVGPRKSDLPYNELDRRLLVTLSQQLAVWLKVAQLLDQYNRRATELQDLVRMYEEVTVQAMTDPLTGLHNRRAFQDYAMRSISEARRYQHPLSLILFDIDLFKRFNDTYGHMLGDQVIATVANALAATVRVSDSSARWGGEEFIVFLPETDLPSALTAAERIRGAVEQARIVNSDGQPLPPITISLGVATLRSEDTLETLIERTDRALYIAKAKGRNQAQTLDHQPTIR